MSACGPQALKKATTQHKIHHAEVPGCRLSAWTLMALRVHFDPRTAQQSTVWRTLSFLLPVHTEVSAECGRSIESKHNGYFSPFDTGHTLEQKEVRTHANTIQTTLHKQHSTTGHERIIRTPPRGVNLSYGCVQKKSWSHVASQVLFPNKREGRAATASPPPTVRNDHILALYFAILSHANTAVVFLACVQSILLVQHSSGPMFDV